MHRSGTSLIARLLSEAGTDLGAHSGLIPGDQWNPDGYYEASDIVALNSRLIHGPLGRFAYFCLPTLETLRQRGRHESPQFAALATKYAGKLAKDPRFTLTAAVWAELSVPIDRIVICIREPSEVASSLRRRNWIPRMMALNLWAIHNSRMLRFIGSRKVCWIHYSHLLTPRNGPNELLRAAQYLGLELSYESAKRIVQQRVRVKATGMPTPKRLYSKNIEALWNTLCERHKVQSEAGL